ncbi:MAG: LAGLIDADG family homing endonuclease [Candidatus Aenigmarchaeota archaeon]|nr:LAGLIDADG family homing endonuclease [Candidatus Aenigmarchaeota archaeon]
MKLSEARITAHVCGDGSIGTYIEKKSLQIVHGRKYKRDRKRYQISYSNTQNILLKEFEKDMLESFGIKSRIWKTELRCRSKRVYDRICILGGGKSRSWFISNEILNNNNSIKKAWLRAFFDDECTIDLTNNVVRIKCVNLNGLKQVEKLLKDINIYSKITGPNCDKTWYLTVPHKEVMNFRKHIKLLHPERRKRIESIS